MLHVIYNYSNLPEVADFFIRHKGFMRSGPKLLKHGVAFYGDDSNIYALKNKFRVLNYRSRRKEDVYDVRTYTNNSLEANTLLYGEDFKFKDGFWCQA